MKGCLKLRLLALSFFALASCKKEETNADAVKEKEIYYRLSNLEKQGWKSTMVSQDVDAMQFSAAEVPIVYYLLKDKGKENLLTVDSLYEANKTERIIEFEFRQDDGKDVLEKVPDRSYEEAVKYMSFHMQDDFYAVTSKNDTIKCAGALFERNYKIAPYSKIVLFFSGVPPEEKLQLVYRDNLFKKGTVKFNFREKIIKL